VSLASAATNYVTKITPYIISRYDNITNQGVPEPQLVGQNQGSLQWQTIGRLSTQTADFVSSFVLLARLMTSTSRDPRSRQIRPQHDGGSRR